MAFLLHRYIRTVEIIYTNTNPVMIAPLLISDMYAAMLNSTKRAPRRSGQLKRAHAFPFNLMFFFIFCLSFFLIMIGQFPKNSDIQNKVYHFMMRKKRGFQRKAYIINNLKKATTIPWVAFLVKHYIHYFSSDATSTMDLLRPAIP